MQANSSSATNQSMQTANNNTLMSQSRSDGKVRFISNHHLSPSLNPYNPQVVPTSPIYITPTTILPTTTTTAAISSATNTNKPIRADSEVRVFIAFHYILDQLMITEH